MKRFAFYVSAILNPFIVFSFLPLVLLYKATNNFSFSFKWFLFTLLFVFFVAYFVYSRVKKGLITDFDVSKREQRKTVLIFSLLVLALYIVAVIFLHAPTTIFLSILGTFTGLVIGGIINTKIKSSGHVAVLTAITSLTVILYGFKFIPLLLLILLLGWSRVTLNRHKISEVITGFFIGVLIAVCMYVFSLVLHLPL